MIKTKTSINIQKLTYMKYRFMYGGSAQGRKSSHSHNNTLKNDVLSYINLLDKCTQILRQDRIWIRNQLKAGDPDITALFKQAKKPLNMQHLQIRLRKFVNSVKSKAKMEQLMKFKQNMQLGEWNKSNDHCPLDKSYKQAYTHQPTKSFSSLSQNLMNNHSNVGRNSQATAMNSSIEKKQKSMIYPYRNKSGVQNSSDRINACEYQGPMQEITERESQNITSARHRIGCEQQGYQGSSSGMNYTYNQWRRPQVYASPLQSLKKQVSPSNRLHRNMQIQPQIIFARKNEQQPAEQIFFEPKSHEQYPSNNRNNYFPSQGYFRDQARHHVHAHEQNPYTVQRSCHQQSRESIKNIKSSQACRQGLPEYENCNVGKDKSSQLQFRSKNNCEETNLLGQSDIFSYNYANISKEENLFTPPELLRECRNFIKSKSGAKPLESNEKFMPPVQNETKPTPLVFENENYYQSKTQKQKSGKQSHAYSSNLQDTMTRPFSNLNCGFIQSVKVSEPLSDQKLFQPIQNNAHHISSQHNPASTYGNEHNQKTYQFFHTFAAQSSQKKEPQPKKIEVAQQLIDTIMNNTSGEATGFIRWSSLVKIIQRKCPQFIQTFVQYLEPAEEQDVLISNVGRVMQDLLEPQNENTNQVRNIYNLLDIDRKGFITEEDIQQFINKLRDAQVQEIDLISDLLWRLYESIDEDSEEGQQKRIDYWGIYARKMTKQFEEINQILKQFQFQIE